MKRLIRRPIKAVESNYLGEYSDLLSASLDSALSTGITDVQIRYDDTGMTISCNILGEDVEVDISYDDLSLQDAAIEDDVLQILEVIRKEI